MEEAVGNEDESLAVGGEKLEEFVEVEDLGEVL